MPRAKKIKTETGKEKAEQKIAKIVIGKIDEPKKNINTKLIFWSMLFVIFLGAVGFGGYFYFQYQKMLKSQPVSAQSEVQLLTEKIGKFVDLPTDEEPTIAEVKDVEKLKGQIFFSGAQNGDKVLIYSKNKRAVLYRPETNKVVEVTSLGEKIENNASKLVAEEAEIQPAPAEDINEEKPAEEKATVSLENESLKPKRIVVYNGTKAKGLAAELGAKILSEIPEMEIVKVGNAVGNYPETIVVDLSGNNLEAVQKIISLIGGESEVLPEGEKKPEGDILVIGGEK